MRTAATARNGLAGLIAVGAGLAAGEVTAAAVSSYASPFYAVGSFLVDRAPAPVREFAIDTFGTNDKPVLLWGIAIAVVVLAIIAGIAERRTVPVGSALIVAFGAFGVLAALHRPTSDMWYAAPSLVAAVVGILVLRGLRGFLWSGSSSGGRVRGSATRQETDPNGDASTEKPQSDGNRDLSRRQFGVAAGVIAAVSVAGAFIGRQVSTMGDVVADRKRVRLPRPSRAAAPIPAGTEVEIEGITPFMTNNADFYRIDTALQVPKLTTGEWKLRIHGMVDNEITLDWDDLMDMQAEEKIITLTCVSNEVGGNLAGTARWIGYPMKTILERAGVQDDADMLFSTSVDGWTSGTPLDDITDGRDAMLVIGMNGEPLPLEHGYPVRQVVPGLYGYVSACKWVVDWEITRFDKAEAYWTKRNWGVKGPIKTASRIDRPEGLSRHPVGDVVIAGTAWAQHRGIAKVEVRVDKGPWNVATLAPEYTNDTWRQWFWTWPATAGQHTVYCRATDVTGAVQPEERVAPIPDGATGWHNRVFRIE
ncbi:molybdopterin-dependent oxidoreductase [Williamsia sp. 1135]|uniref:molybdopterin-dependent oxidoreductase n=1 Tax=Williamsia sp. 1135 TaxID=1889262 RepID=UPI000A122654|nr:molybdopterin-dependent oxidoreductase [Williamsia sp. 1135]ORM27708.1 oxidoreductase [Williamsia sp. 1135]